MSKTVQCWTVILVALIATNHAIDYANIQENSKCDGQDSVSCHPSLCSGLYRLCKDGKWSTERKSPGDLICVGAELIPTNEKLCGSSASHPSRGNTEIDQDYGSLQNGGKVDLEKCTADGIQCQPADCCPYYYSCLDSIPSGINASPEGTVCFKDRLIPEKDQRCQNIPCNSTSLPQLPKCGDGVCHFGVENCNNCPTDCVECTKVPFLGVYSGAARADGLNRAVFVRNKKRNVGYYTNWSQYRSAAGGKYRFFPENIDGNMYTHLNFAFAKVSDNTWMIEPYEWNDVLDYTAGMYERFNSLKTKYPHLRTLISIGGWNFNYFGATKTIFSRMCSTKEGRATFIKNSIEFLRKHNFDGLDIDWEYPGWADQGGQPQDYTNFPLLLKEFRSAISAEKIPTGKRRLLLTIAAPAGLAQIKAGYDIKNIHPHLDFINIMTYDFHGAWEPVTGANAPLFDRTSTLNIASAIKAWMTGGIPRSKLTLGLPTYGRTWTLSDPTNRKMGAPASGPGTAGPITGEAGFLSWYEIKAMMDKKPKIFYDAPRKVPYLALDNQWVSYDNESSLQLKVDFLLSQSMGGSMIWAMDLDDFTANYPLVTAIVERLWAAPKMVYLPVSNQTSSGLSRFLFSKQESDNLAELFAVIADKDNEDPDYQNAAEIILQKFEPVLDSISEQLDIPREFLGISLENVKDNSLSIPLGIFAPDGNQADDIINKITAAVQQGEFVSFGIEKKSLDHHESSPGPSKPSGIARLVRNLALILALGGCVIASIVYIGKKKRRHISLPASSTNKHAPITQPILQQSSPKHVERISRPHVDRMRPQLTDETHELND